MLDQSNVIWQYFIIYIRPYNIFFYKSIIYLYIKLITATASSLSSVFKFGYKKYVYSIPIVLQFSVQLEAVIY